MSELEQTQEELALELETVKSQLDMLGVKYHHNAKLETLQKLLSETLAEKEKTSKETKDVKQIKSVREQVLKPVFCNVTCLNPAKKSWRGEKFYFGNSVVGRCVDFVPYNCEASQGIWLPALLVQVLKERRYLHTSTLSEKERGVSPVAHRTDWMPEFSVEIVEK